MIFWLHICIFAVLFLALVFCATMWIVTHWHYFQPVALWRAMRRRMRWFVLILVLGVTYVGADKGGGSAATRYLAQYLTILSNGTMLGPTNQIASAAAAAAVAAVNAESANMLAIASNTLLWAETDIPIIEEAVTNTIISWITADIPQNLSQSNLVARCDLIHTSAATNGTISAFVAFNQQPATAPICTFEGSLDGTNWLTFAATSNSFPTLYPISTSEGVVSCLEYVVTIPDTMLTVTVIPQREMTFGGGSSNTPLQVLGAIMVDSHIGRDATVDVATNEQWLFEGGLLVGVLTNGVPIP
jgi:hypothetical protein